MNWYDMTRHDALQYVFEASAAVFQGNSSSEGQVLYVLTSETLALLQLRRHHQHSSANAHRVLGWTIGYL